jgi:MtN3 and saliva related transmembrane protein
METIGWIGSVLLAFCGLPQAIESWRTKNSDGLTWSFLLMWGVGEIFTIIYILPKWHWPLIFNYTANIIFISIILYYKIKPKR